MPRRVAPALAGLALVAAAIGGVELWVLMPSRPQPHHSPHLLAAMISFFVAAVLLGLALYLRKESPAKTRAWVDLVVSTLLAASGAFALWGSSPQRGGRSSFSWPSSFGMAAWSTVTAMKQLRKTAHH